MTGQNSPPPAPIPRHTHTYPPSFLCIHQNAVKRRIAVKRCVSENKQASFTFVFCYGEQSTRSYFLLCYVVKSWEVRFEREEALV